MTQARINRAVARATGESLGTIQRRGFSIADPASVCHDPEPFDVPSIVDWDDLHASRIALLPNRSACRAMAA
jgi:hypothetical protein